MPVNPGAAAALAVAASAAAGLALAYRVLCVGAFSPWRDVFLGVPAAPSPSGKLAAGKQPGEEVSVDIEAAGFVVRGTADAAYAEAVDVFVRNIVEGHEVGAGFCLYVEGKKVVDLAGGRLVGGKEYDRSSANVVMSSGKAVMSVVVAFCVSKGYLKLEDRVATVWPEFAAGNKENVLVKDILQSRGGLAWLNPEHCPTAEESWDLDVLAAKIAPQPHNFGGKKTQMYHGLTRGWFINEVLRRTHPKGYSARQILDEEIMPLLQEPDDPFGLPVYVSVPETPEAMARLRTLHTYPTARTLLRFFLPRFMNPEPIPQVYIERSKKPNPYLAKMTTTVPVMTRPDPVTGARPEKDLLKLIDTWSIRRGEHTSFGVVTSARAMARLAAVVCNGGTLDGAEVIDAQTVAHCVEADPWVEEDLILAFPGTFTNAGWGIHGDVRYPQRPSEAAWKKPGWSWCGWAGFGGSMMQFEPKRNIAFGYCPTGLQLAPYGDFRSARLLEACLDVYDRMHGET
ncbi:beta-lactamase/transpeptidase-like protein [Hyaloraphidium curvatum]|nr:beta-lactamase/transpeptidase-like protein [Hyaloraphidium curvatum]